MGAKPLIANRTLILGDYGAQGWIDGLKQLGATQHASAVFFRRATRYPA